MPNYRPNHHTNDEPKVGDRGDSRGGGGDCSDANKKRSISNKLTSISASRNDLPLVKLDDGNKKNGDEDEVMMEPQPTREDGGETGMFSKQHTSHNVRVEGIDASLRQQRQVWRNDQPVTWWKQCISPDYPDTKFRSHFRMCRETFDMICDELGSAIAKEDTPSRPAIPVCQRVAVCIWRLATGDAFHVISNRFGLANSTCQKIVLEVCVAIESILMPRFIRWPGQATALEASFKAISGIPNVIGSMYTTHISIIAPRFFPLHYCNHICIRGSFYSIIFQGVVDPDGTFIHVSIGWPGSMSDDRVVDQSHLSHLYGNDAMAGSWVVGGTNYPLNDWLLVPYTHQNLTREQQIFNENVTKLNHVAKDAFARLKGRWACLQKRADVNIKNFVLMAGACSVLHNICEVNKEEMDPELQCHVLDDKIVPKNLVRSESASKARDKIAHNLFHRDLDGSTMW
ncbi:protein ALP1-like [Brachypodium distachyon]|uniref:protein ALP1-like n=1 Tax=Brachypodium distachyon TaxID=15368 RepID=UPI000234DEE8|nr:protein ALP1-like [Brachypodium distachyon]|eukprot:XP_003567313.1 protein ALP1-like [Brachypodium distachyon]